jgi:pre-60S factor REI1
LLFPTPDTLIPWTSSQHLSSTILASSVGAIGSKMSEQQEENLELTSTTAPGQTFPTRTALAEHYKTDWHKYNLKRRQANLPVLLEPDFQARLEAAKALQQTKQVGTNHLKQNSKSNKQRNSNRDAAKNGVVQLPQASAYHRIKEEELQNQNHKNQMELETPIGATAAELALADTMEPETVAQLAAEALVEIEPRQCLFDPHMSPSVEANVDRMSRKYGFFVPDREYLTDLEGLVGYCQEKIKLGHVCIYCQRVFTTWQGCQKHMIATRHCKVRYEPNVDLEEYAVFYDFTAADNDFLGRIKKNASNANAHDLKEEMEVDDTVGIKDEDDWEDVSEDEEEAENEDMNAVDDEDEALYNGYEEEIHGMGFGVTPLGELIFPDGRIIGHRALRRYYKQRPVMPNQSTAVVAARHAAGERLYRGRVYNIGGETASTNTNTTEDALAFRQAGIAPGLAAGRAGKGILVSSNAGAFSQVSVYRYRAAIRKQRRGNDEGHRLWNKSNQNINRMDKKHNRLMNGVSVAHAAR